MIDGNAGNDRILGRAGDDRLTGGLGNDRIFGGAGNDTIAGVQGNDWLNGGAGNDTISGDANNTGDRTSFDRIFGAAGDDTLHGGDSRDRIFGGSGNDTSLRRERQRPHGRRHRQRPAGRRGRQRHDLRQPRPGRRPRAATATTTCGRSPAATCTPGPGGAVDQVGDTLDGGNGNDTFHTRDGEVDRITCGPGNDTALLDQVDVITDATAANPNGSCERVVRKAPQAARVADRGRAAVAEGRARAAPDGTTADARKRSAGTARPGLPRGRGGRSASARRDGRQHRGADRRDDDRGGQERDRPALGRPRRVADPPPRVEPDRPADDGQDRRGREQPRPVAVRGRRERHPASEVKLSAMRCHDSAVRSRARPRVARAPQRLKASITTITATRTATAPMPTASRRGGPPNGSGCPRRIARWLASQRR